MVGFTTVCFYRSTTAQVRLSLEYHTHTAYAEPAKLAGRSTKDVFQRLETEVGSIEELVELEEGDPHTTRWALNALISHRRELASLLDQSQVERKRDLLAQARAACQELVRLDPTRASRYKSLLNHESSATTNKM